MAGILETGGGFGERLRVIPSPYHDGGLSDELGQALVDVWRRLALPLKAGPLAAA